jgi:hypothetical protein
LFCFYLYLCSVFWIRIDFVSNFNLSRAFFSSWYIVLRRYDIHIHNGKSMDARRTMSDPHTYYKSVTTMAGKRSTEEEENSNSNTVGLNFQPATSFNFVLDLCLFSNFSHFYWSIYLTYFINLIKYME